MSEGAEGSDVAKGEAPYREPSDPTKRDDAAKGSTRGVAVITLAKVFFMLTGFAQPLLLTRILGASGYGVYGSVLNAVSILNNVVVAGSIQAMSRSVTEHGPGALRKGLALHAALGVFVGGSLALGSDVLGRGLLGDPELPSLLRIAAIVAGNYSVYAALVGALNGRRRFVAQAGLDMTFATLRTGLVIGLGATAWRVTGSIAGFALASAVITLVALVLVLRGGGERDESNAHESKSATHEPAGAWAFAKSYLGFFAPVLLYQLALNLVLQADLLVLKALLVRREGLSLERVNELVGVYKSVQNFAFLPYQLLLSVTFVAFPVVSQATLEGDSATMQRFVRNAMRFSAIALGAMLAVLVGLPEGVLRLAYRPEVAVGAGALRTLALGMGGFALAVISTTIVLAKKRTAAATAVMLVMLVAVFAGDAVGISLAPTGPGALVGAASGTAAGCLVGCVLAGIYLKKLVGAFVPLGTLVRVAAAVAASAAAVALVPLRGKVVTLGLSAVAVVLYLAVVLLAGEVSAGERAAITGAVRRRLGKR